MSYKNTAKKLLDHGKQSATDVLKTFLKRPIQKTAEATSNLIGDNIKSQKFQKNKLQNNSETNTN